MSHLRGPGKVIVEKDVWIGPSCTIVSAAGETRKIGKGAVISAGSVINRDVPPFTLMSGVPAKPVARITVPLASTANVNKFIRGLRPLR